MPGSYLIDVPRGIVFSRGWGILTDAELYSHAVTLRADARFDSGFRQVVDFLGITRLKATGAGVTRVARNNPFRREARRAIIVPTDEAFGLTRMFEIYADADPEMFNIFRDIGQALKGIGLEPESPWPPEKPDATFGVE